jgi:malate dehydrogenase (oxaloacetate-decarboxylating)(NADP+)
VAVISNGTAVLGLGNIGPLASKPVMEGKGVLFKKFAAIDVFDIEIAENDPDKLVDIIASLEPTFGGVNLEDIKAPECFYIERKLRERMKIPVFHDDQHGTAIIVGAAILNGLKVVNKDIKNCKLVVSGAGAAALACLDLIVDLGFPIENIFVTDLAGVVYKGRVELMDPDKERFARETPHRTLTDIIPDADIFLGLSAGGVLKPEMVAKMAPNPIILALANPNPEILPEDAKAVRSDVIIATGRSDYPNQVNNVLCFPYIFRGALDCGATTITREMEIAVVHAIADLAHAEQSDVVASTYGINNLSFGPEYLIPMPFDPRLLTHIAPAVAKAAMEGGVAARPIADLDAYAESLQQIVYRSGSFMKPLFQVAKSAPPELKRIVYAEGEDERVLRAVQVVVDERLARPILVGRPAVLEQRIQKFGLRLKLGEHFDVINPDFDERYRDYWQTYHQMVMRKGVTADMAKLAMRRRHTLIGAMMIHKGDADGMICGTYGTTWTHLDFIDKVLGMRAGAKVYAAMNFVITEERQLAMVDTHVNENPTAKSWPRSRSWRPRNSSASASPRAWRCCRIRISAPRTASRRKRCAPRWRWCSRRRRTWNRRRDARRRGARCEAARQADAAVDAQGRRQPGGHAGHRFGQHRLQPAQDGGRQRHRGRPGPARLRQTGAYPDPVGHGAPHRQHDGAVRRRCGVEPLTNLDNPG